jgi:hypothetical protein
MDHQRTTSIESPGINMPKVAEGAGFEPARGVNPCRFSRPFHGFQARLKQTKQDQERLIAPSLLRNGRFVWFCPI